MSQLSDLKVDIAIAGGGPVGSALALALAPQGYTVTLLNPPAPGAPDLRPLALSYGSRLILERLGVWSQVFWRWPFSTTIPKNAKRLCNSS